MKSLAFASLFFFGCGLARYCALPVHKPEAKCVAYGIASKCALPEVERLAGSILGDVMVALASSNYGPLIDQIVATLAGQGVTDAIGVVTCAVTSVSMNAPADRVRGSGSLATVRANAQAWLASQAKR